MLSCDAKAPLYEHTRMLCSADMKVSVWSPLALCVDADVRVLEH